MRKNIQNIYLLALPDRLPARSVPYRRRIRPSKVLQCLQGPYQKLYEAFTDQDILALIGFYVCESAEREV